MHVLSIRRICIKLKCIRIAMDPQYSTFRSLENIMPATRIAIISIFIISCLLSLALITLHLNFGSTNCHIGSFLCSKSDVCIANKYKCNHFRDCLHGEDENPLTCADLHGGINYYDEAIKINWTYFYKIRQTKPNIPCALSGYPPECDCRNETSLRCNGVGLIEVPRHISNNVKKISMINNSIILSNESFDGYYSLTMIHLQHNRLLRVPPYVFQHQNKLIWLHLLNNNLKMLEKNAFYGLNNVRNLFLDNNYLEFLNLNSWQHMTELSWLDLSFNLLTFKNECFPYLASLTILHLSWNRIETINELLLQNIPNLRHLDLSNNMITKIHENAFQNSSKLADLNISNNRIIIIIPKIFYPLKLLNKFALGNNPITKIKGEMFNKMKHLSSLDIKGITKENIEMTLFDNLTQLKFLYLKEFHYCVLYAKHVDVCQPNVDGLSSSLNLLPKPIFRWTLWIVTICTLIMNMLVLYGRIFSSLRDENEAINFVIRNLAIADMFMVVYLVVIGIHDKTYENEYYIYAHKWESSKLCTMIGITAMISTEVSMLILVFLSLERFLLIAVPFSGYQVLKFKTAQFCMVSIWIVGFLISIAPLILSKHSSKFYGSNGFCYPLYIEDPFVDGWQYSVFIFLGLHTMSLLLMVILYSLMFLSVRQTRQAARISAGDFDFAVRFFFIVLANSLCWLPIIILKFAALNKFHISSKMYGWVIIFVVPINALVNPLLYTFTTPKYKNSFKILYHDLFSLSKGIKLLKLYPNPKSMNIRMFKINRNQLQEKQIENSNTQENSFETTNAE